MIEKSAQPGEEGGARPPPFTIYTIKYKIVVYAQAERADTLLLFLLYPYLFSVREISTGYRHCSWAKAFRRRTVDFLSSICSECINVLPRLNCTQTETGLRRRARTPLWLFFSNN
jgi:hypothetical protein